MILADLYRFGYDLTVLTETKEEAEKLLMEEYEKQYRKINDGEDPREEIAYDHYSDESYYDEAKECIEYRELEIGKVEWL